MNEMRRIKKMWRFQKKKKKIEIEQEKKKEEKKIVILKIIQAFVTPVLQFLIFMSDWLQLWNQGKKV